MATPYDSINSFLTYTSLLGQQSGGGSGSPSNWSSYPALTNVDLGGNVLTKGRMSVTSNAFSTSNPMVFGTADTGDGNPNPADFSLLRGTWVKHDPSGNATEPFTIDIGYNGTTGWTIGTVWNGYIGIPLTLAGDPVQVINTGTGIGQVLILSNTMTGGGGYFNVDSNSNLFWNSNQLTPVSGGGSGLTLLNNDQNFAVPISSMMLPTGGSTSNFTGTTSSFTPPTTKVIVDAMVSVADGTGMGDFITFGVADSASPSVPLVVTQATIPAGTVITLSISGVIAVSAGVPTTLVLVACSQTNPCYVNNSYSLTITG